MNVVCCLPAFGSKRQLVPARLPTLICVSVSMQPPPVASNPGFHPGFYLQALQNKIRDGKLGFEATPTAEDNLSKSVSTRDKWLIGFSQ